MKKFAIIFLFLSVLCLPLAAQTKARKTTKKNAKPAEAVTPAAPAENAETGAPQKKNLRDDAPPASDAGTPPPQKKNQAERPNNSGRPKPAEQFKYFYEFTHRDFVVTRLVIEHDDSGKGKVTFEKKDFDEPVSDPVQLSAATLEKLKTLFQTLDFVNSSENYQSAERDYKHLGTAKIRVRDGGKERAVEYNWTENKDAKALADEYRRIGNQYVWQFDMSVSRENQPLEAPGLMDALDSYLKRNEISDPPQMIPFLQQLANDERIPLIARNRATKLIKEIEKKKTK